MPYPSCPDQKCFANSFATAPTVRLIVSLPRDFISTKAILSLLALENERLRHSSADSFPGAANLWNYFQLDVRKIVYSDQFKDSTLSSKTEFVTQVVYKSFDSFCRPIYVVGSLQYFL